MLNKVCNRLFVFFLLLSVFEKQGKGKCTFKQTIIPVARFGSVADAARKMNLGIKFGFVRSVKVQSRMFGFSHIDYTIYTLWACAMKAANTHSSKH